MLGENSQTIRENAEILVEASNAIGLEVNPEKTKYMIMSRDQNILRNGTIKIGDLSFEEVEKFKYLGATVTNINDTREEIKHRINVGNACYYSVEELLSSSLLSKNVKVRIYKTVILQVVLYGYETWTLTLREEHRLRVFENKILRKIFGGKRDEVTGEWRKLHNAELHALYTSPDIIRNIKSRRLRWAGHVARMGDSRNAYRVLVGRPERKRPLGRARRSDEATFHTSGKINKHNCRVWGTQKPHRIIEHERDSPKVNVFCALSQRKLYGPFFFIEATVTGHSYLEQWLVPQLKLSMTISSFSKMGLRHISTMQFDRVFVPPLPRDLEELKTRIREAAATVTEDMLKRVWEGFDYHLDICRVTRGSHIESLLLSKILKVRIYKTVILSVLLYGCETWTLTLSEEHRLRVFENKVLRKIFGAKRDEVTGEWRKLHNAELHALYSSADIIRNIKSRRLRWAGHVARMGESRNEYRVLVGRPEGKRPLGRPRHTWEDNIKMDFREVGYDDRDWINLAQDRDRWRAYVRAAMNLREARESVPPLIFYQNKIHMSVFADDITLLAEEEMILRYMLLELNDSCEQYGMNIKSNETKSMVIGRNIKKVNLRILNEAVEQVDSFKYLGCTVSSNMSCCQEVKRRIAMAKRAFNRKRSSLCGPLEKELRKILLKCRSLLYNRAIDVAQSADSLGCCSGAAFGLGLDPPLDFGFFRGFPQPWD
ncbi:hypothetical protein ANN_22890 [Periplaneta americana]|uniref:Reverse transcriptase domain-containing protein n=1 Tax=Periplaneta americana TaxID=6978 RepID=A0ABQ8SK06_PERAM|nr:hypothetical protein ANN_22890 [Periplaneta americana]